MSMICYHRKNAWITDDGLVFKDPPKYARHVTVPCGKCAACRVNNSEQWATRVVHEFECSNGRGCFVTLTYNKEHLPEGYNLCKRDLQLFLKNLRITLQRAGQNIRAFLACGEYGSKRGRPHYHVVIIGWQPTDGIFLRKSYSGMDIYRSPLIEKIWKRGFCPFGTLTRASAGYVARYTKKDFNNDGGRVPSFMTSSRNIPLTNGEQGALGAQWVLDNMDVLRHGYIRTPQLPDLRLRIPEYYFDLVQRWKPELYESIKQLRYDFAMESNHGLYHFEDRDLGLVAVAEPSTTPTMCHDFAEELGVNLYGMDIDDVIPSVCRAWTDVLRREAARQDKKIKESLLRHLSKR